MEKIMLAREILNNVKFVISISNRYANDFEDELVKLNTFIINGDCALPIEENLPQILQIIKENNTEILARDDAFLEKNFDPPLADLLPAIRKNWGMFSEEDKKKDVAEAY